jgi:hypothetical protein
MSSAARGNLAVTSNNAQRGHGHGHYYRDPLRVTARCCFAAFITSTSLCVGDLGLVLPLPCLMRAPCWVLGARPSRCSLLARGLGWGPLGRAHRLWLLD